MDRNLSGIARIRMRIGAGLNLCWAGLKTHSAQFQALCGVVGIVATIAIAFFTYRLAEQSISVSKLQAEIMKAQQMPVFIVRVDTNAFQIDGSTEVDYLTNVTIDNAGGPVTQFYVSQVTYLEITNYETDSKGELQLFAWQLPVSEFFGSPAEINGARLAEFSAPFPNQANMSHAYRLFSEFQQLAPGYTWDFHVHTFIRLRFSDSFDEDTLQEKYYQIVDGYNVRKSDKEIWDVADGRYPSDLAGLRIGPTPEIDAGGPPLRLSSATGQNFYEMWRRYDELGWEGYWSELEDI